MAERLKEPVVFFATGFETTAVATAAIVLKGLPDNLSILSAHKFIPPAMDVVAATPGLDRIAMLIAGEDSIREVIAFPKNNKGSDLMAHSPCEIGFKELREVYILSTWKDPKLAKEKATAEAP